MNILKANRAINPSKINLSGEMLHFYFRARSRPPARAAAPLRTQRRAAPRSPRKGRGGGLSMPCRGAGRLGLGYAWELATTPPHLSPPPPSTELMGIRKGLLRSRVPVGNGTRLSKGGGGGVVKQPSTEQVMAMPRFERFCWAVREDTHDPPTHLPPVLGARSFPEVPSSLSAGQRRWGLGAEGFGFADLPGLE